MDVGRKQKAEDPPQEQSLAAALPEWAREREDGQWYAPADERRPGQQAGLKPPSKLIVVVPDEDGGNWSKARVFDNLREAAGLVETLVEAGLSQERVTVFGGAQIGISVAYQPVVHFQRSEEKREPASKRKARARPT